MRKSLNGTSGTSASFVRSRSVRCRYLGAKILASCLALSSLMTLCQSTSAGAIGGQTISCKKFTGNTSGNIVFDRSSCSPKPPARYGNLSGLASSFGSLSWRDGDFISIGNISYVTVQVP